MTSFRVTVTQRPAEFGANLRVVFEEPFVSWSDVAEVLDAVDTSVRWLQELILEGARDFVDGDAILLDAVRARVRDARRQSLVVQSIEVGSLIVSATVVGIAVVILKNTVGESLKEGWKNSEAHHRLVDYTTHLLNDTLRRPDRVAHAIREWCRERLPQVEVHEPGNDDHVTIRVRQPRGTSE